MNRLKTNQEKQMELYNNRMKQYKADSLGEGWFWGVMAIALILTAIIENI